ncbi:murein hydrolase activator EnvC family protein [Rhizomicrobium electricum]|uniref:Murein hydrolase activator EnvC n=1 Tax=Rhizomicrobium electricum TaxID=480070 RepID=A0ABP3QBJ8_9PROT|nr:peptidoglycan DD-metalloendopeptidase family protein [Rhizomicrobium electricum]NIJ50791.1 septal ring factor EnvC (AmiA/AmiB activator) [Rhizomicrobium electricum]
MPHPRPAVKQAQNSPPPAKSAPSSDGISDADMQKAVPLKQYLDQPRPSATDRYKNLAGEVAKNKPALDTAKKASDDLARQTAALQKQLVDSAARIESLEREKMAIDATVERLTADYARLSASFEQDRGTVIRLLALVERVNHDNPPAMAVRPGDALGASRAAMLLGAWLPPRYTEAATLARRIAALKRTRAELTQRRAEATRNAMALTQANADLDRLLAVKRQQADLAAARYGVLKTRLDTIASQAVDLQTLLKKVAQLRAAPSSPAVITVNAPRGKGWLRSPVVGAYNSGGVDGVGGSTAPGITFATVSGATVVAPADGNVIFAGQSGKAGRVLILEIGAGYDVLLAGLDRFDVRSGDAVLAGEPVGVMPKFDHEPRLYFELRPKNGKGMSPAPYLAVTLRKAR